ncbi:MAG: lipoate--protein ligase [Bacteroidia bacterium]|nr:lipoate--protein ligase [Bacteroidia bacterium]
MLCLDMKTTNPFFNLAVDEYLLKNKKDEYLILGINSPAIIIGKHQVAQREADTRFVHEKGIPVIRRISGGGTVYHDFGNLNFTFILNSAIGRQVDFRKYTLPVIEFLVTMGVKAEFEGKNDLKVNGLKISGNAEHVYRNRVMHHGTLLFSTLLDDLRVSLRKDKSSYSTRAVESNPSPVMNLKEIIGQLNSIIDFRSAMLEFFLKRQGNTLTELTAEERSKIQELERLIYRTWGWNYAYGPDYYFINKFEHNGKQHFCRLFVQGGIIRECEMEGSGEMIAAGRKLKGCRHMVKDLIEVFKQEKINIRGSQIYKFF